MIDVSGEVIYFEGRPVGFIIVPEGSHRGRFIEALEDRPDYERRLAVLDKTDERFADIREALSELSALVEKTDDTLVSLLPDHIQAVLEKIGEIQELAKFEVEE